LANWENFVLSHNVDFFGPPFQQVIKTGVSVRIFVCCFVGYKDWASRSMTENIPEKNPEENLCG
jgi:hypothetical protein